MISCARCIPFVPCTTSELSEVTFEPISGLIRSAKCVRKLDDEPIGESGFWRKGQLLRRVPFFNSHNLHPSLTCFAFQMHAARLVCPIRAANRQFSRSLATATATTTRVHDTVIPLSNVEAQWDKMTADEQLTVHQQLEELQKRDWKTLSLDEKKAGAYTRLFLEIFLYRLTRTRNNRCPLRYYLQRTTLPLDLTDPAPPFIHRVAYQRSCWRSWLALAPEVLYS
jgi:hypothetical protein